MSFENLASKLAPFETFDRSAFVPDSKTPQNLCDFVLTLALAYNDFRDIFFSRELLDEVQVDVQGPRTIKLALRNSIENTIVRVQSGFIHELLALLSKHETTVKNAAFRELFRKMSKPARNAWEALMDAAMNKTSNNPLAHSLLMIRNKVAFHYDAGQLGRGFKTAFFDDSRYGQPLISRGSTLSQTRFYFADASSQAYIFSQATTAQAMEFLRGQGDFIASINQTLYEIVTRFVQARTGWSKPKICLTFSAKQRRLTEPILKGEV